MDSKNVKMILNVLKLCMKHPQDNAAKHGKLCSKEGSQGYKQIRSLRY